MNDTKRWFDRGACHTTPHDRRNQRRIIAWSFTWMACWTAAALALKNGWIGLGLPGVVAVVVTTVLGIGTLVAYHRFLREADELRRKIELDALALAFGVGVVGGFAYWLLARTGAVAEADLLHVVVVMIFTHTLGILIGYRRYA